MQFAKLPLNIGNVYSRSARSLFVQRMMTYESIYLCTPFCPKVVWNHHRLAPWPFFV